MISEGNDRAAEEAEAAAEEAGAIGGPNPDPDLTEEERVISEGGEGESEGFELAEQDLERNASHDPDGQGNPLLDRIDEDGAKPTAEYGEADQEGDEEQE